MGLSGVIIFTVSVAICWPIIDTTPQYEKSCSMVETEDWSSTQFTDSSCFGQCTLALQNDACETEMCSKNVTIPAVYSDGMICVRGGQAIVDRTVTTTECQVSYKIIPKKGLQWHIIVSTGSLCKAICYNLAALFKSPHPFNAEAFTVSSTNEEHPYVLPISPNSVYCTLGGNRLDMYKDTRDPVRASGECKLEYAQSTKSHKMVPAVLATANPPDEAVVRCGVTCVSSESAVVLKYLKKFTEGGKIVTSEDCPYCSLDEWSVVLPVPDSSNVTPQCTLTRDKEDYWHFQINGAPAVECSVLCSCVEQSHMTNKTECSADTTT